VKIATRSKGSLALTVERGALGDEPDEVAYWWTVSQVERVAAVEILRQRMNGGGNATRPGLQRLCRTLHR
jgi:hypothetical protein